MQTTQLSIPLSKLRFGQEHPKGSINSRTAGRDEIDDLLPSIQAKGVLLPIVVEEYEGVYYTAAGNRRLLAMFTAHPDKRTWDTITVPAVTHADGNSLEISTIENVQRKPLHPVDQFENFAALVAQGIGYEDICATFLLKMPQLRQALSLAKLAPRIRAAWRDGKINAETAEAFALARDQKTQEATFDRLMKGSRHGFNAWQVRQALGGTGDEVKSLLKFVGQKTYEEAGHAINQTLFSREEGEATVSDIGALKNLAAAKVEEARKKLVADGWGWVITDDDRPNDSYSWRRLYPEGSAKDFLAEQKKRAGCIVGIDHNGRLSIDKGLIKPSDKVRVGAEERSPEERKKAKAKKAAGGGTITNALAMRLSEQLTRAAAEAVRRLPAVGFDIAIAALTANTTEWDRGAKLSHNGLGSAAGQRSAGTFKTLFENVTAMKEPEKLAALATIVGKSFDFRSADAKLLAEVRKAHEAMFAALGPELVEAAQKLFDAKDYFNSVPKPRILRAIEEAVNADEARKIAGKPKGEIAKFAILNVARTAWLPPELRTAHYKGPGAAEKPAKAKKATVTTGTRSRARQAA